MLPFPSMIGFEVEEAQLRPDAATSVILVSCIVSQLNLLSHLPLLTTTTIEECCAAMISRSSGYLVFCIRLAPVV